MQLPKFFKINENLFNEKLLVFSCSE